MPLPAAQQAAKITKAAAAKAAKAAKPVEEVAPKAALTALTPVGESDNWNKGKANHIRIGSLFLAHVHETDAVLSEKCGLVWEEVPEEQAASFHVFAMLASYLVTTYSTKDASAAHSEYLSKKSAEGYWSSLLHDVKRRFGTSSSLETQASMRARSCARACPPIVPELACHCHLSACAAPQQFLKCLDGDNSDAARWYSGIKSKMNRLIFQRDLHLPKSQDTNENAILLEHVKVCDVPLHPALALFHAPS